RTARVFAKASEHDQLKTDVFGENCIEDVQDDEHSGRPCTSETSENIQDIEQITVRQILHENLNLTKVCATVVPKLLTPDQKEKKPHSFCSIGTVLFGLSCRKRAAAPLPSFLANSSHFPAFKDCQKSKH
uniref:Uncharacterized protein n=1 Tax=Mola mola TaxID=94237 RepID=A0A3Q3VLQ9_MOLML